MLCFDTRISLVPSITSPWLTYLQRTAPTNNAALQRGQSTRPPPPSSGPARAFPKTPWVLGGLAVYGLSAYGAYLYHSYRRTVAASREQHVPDDVSDRYDATASTFDAQVNTTEWLIGLERRRRQLARRARGDVLEVSVGTGRNMRYYAEHQCRTFTFVDKSGPMLELARERFAAKHPQFKNVTFLQQDATAPIPAPPPPSPEPSPESSSLSSSSSTTTKTTFDTVLQTMGLCSTGKPVELLKHLGSVTNPDGGQILLLEHGRSHYDWLNVILDGLAKAHADKHGCWWNRDIGRIVDESGLEVVCVKRFNLGTTWWVELRPPSSSSSSSPPPPPPQKT